MLVGAVMGFWTVQHVHANTGIALAAAVVVAGLVGAALSAIHAFLVITLRASQIVSGLALTIFAGAVGLSSYLGNDLNLAGSPAVHTFSAVFPASMQRWPVVGPIVFGQNVLVYISWACVVGDLALPVAHAPRPERPRGRRVAGGRRHDGHQRDAVPLCPHARRRRVRGRRRRDDHAGDHAAVGGRDHRRRRLDRDRARHLRLLAAGALPRRRVLLRCSPGTRARSCRPATSVSGRRCCGRTRCRT